MSGSESATDLLILQKKLQPEAELPRWLAIAEADYPRSSDHRSMTVGSRYTREIKDPEELAEARASVNQCWLDQPERVVGQPVVVASDNSLWLQVTPPGDLATTLQARLAALLPAWVLAPFDPHQLAQTAEPIAPSPLHERRAEQITIPTLGGLAQERATGLAGIYNAAKALICAELNDEPRVDDTRARLNQVYEGFVWQYGVIHDPRNQRLFGDLPELQFLLGLERNPRRTPSGRWRADRERIFFERTLRPHQPPLPGTLTPTEALLRCLDERGGLDTTYIANLAGLPDTQVVEALGERVYRLPGTSQYELADVYLSGDVVAKLRDAQAWAERDPMFERNVAALTAVQPQPLGPKEIILNLNAFWLPSSVVTAFSKTLLPAWTGEASYRTSLGEWLLSDPGKQAEAEQGGSAAAPAEAAQAAGELARDVASLGDVLLAIAQEERADDGWGAWQPVLPPSPARWPGWPPRSSAGPCSARLTPSRCLWRSLTRQWCRFSPPRMGCSVPRARPAPSLALPDPSGVCQSRSRTGRPTASPR